MVRKGVKVVIRTRPTATFAQNQIQINQDDSTVSINSSSLSNSSSSHTSSNEGPSNKKESWKFRFHQVLHNASQSTVYDEIALDIVQSSVVDGINGTILAYGQTGAGKTFTMIGDTSNYQHRGIAPRAAADLFREIEDRIEIAYTVHVSYMEIYNDRIFDLLDKSEPSSDKSKKEYVIVEDSKGSFVRGLSQIPVENEKEALDELFHGELQRTVAEHRLNKCSNRSHCIFTFHVSQKPRSGGSERVVHSKLHLVDLAGSERLKKTMKDKQGVEGQDSAIKKESMYINQSLSFLEQCIVALGSKEQRHIPYRQTKLTNVLKDSLGGNSNTLMYACIWGESKHLEETISTLKLAQRMMRVQNETSSIVETDPALLLKRYEREIKELKQELIMHDALVERKGVVYEEHTPEQKHELMRMLRHYVDASPENEDNVLVLSSVHQIRELFRQCKILIKNAESMNGGGGGGIGGGMYAGALESRGSTAKTDVNGGLLGTGMDGGEGGDYNEEKNKVGDQEEMGGFAVGIAADAARPTVLDRSLAPSSLSMNSNQGDENGEKGMEDHGHSPTGPRKFGGQLGDGFTPNGAANMDRNDAFKEKQHARNLKLKIKAETMAANDTKNLIDDLRCKIEEKRQANAMDSRDLETSGIGNDEEVVDEEEFILMQEAKDAKKEYRRAFDTLREYKQEHAEVARRMDELKRRLIDSFEEWFRQGGGEISAMDQSLDQMNREMDMATRTFGTFEMTSNENEEGDKLDDDEMFAKMEMDNVVAKDPDSLAFFQAQKSMRHASNTSSSTIKQRQKAKRGI